MKHFLRIYRISLVSGKILKKTGLRSVESAFLSDIQTGDQVSLKGGRLEHNSLMEVERMTLLESAQQTQKQDFTNYAQNTQQEQQARHTVPVDSGPVAEDDACGNTPMPLPLDQLIAEWPVPAQDSTMEDLYRMAMLVISSMPPQQRAMLRREERQC